MLIFESEKVLIKNFGEPLQVLLAMKVSIYLLGVLVFEELIGGGKISVACSYKIFGREKLDMFKSKVVLSFEG